MNNLLAKRDKLKAFLEDKEQGRVTDTGRAVRVSYIAVTSTP